MRAKHSAFILLAGAMLVPTFSWGQFPGGRGGKKGFGDPEAIFNKFAKGGNSIRREDLNDQEKLGFDFFAQMYGFTGTEVTREQFMQGSASLSEKIRSGQIQIPGMGGNRGGMGPGGNGGGNSDRFLDEEFNRYDKNGNGILENDELSEEMQAQRDSLDTNHDGVIDLNEYKAFANAKFNQRRGGEENNRGGRSGGDDNHDTKKQEEEEKRPFIQRANNLPKDLPPWFAELDRSGDADGQIGLYEWKNSSRKLSEFTNMDLNKDGFLTVDEYRRWKRQADEELAKKSGYIKPYEPILASNDSRNGRNGGGPGGPGGGMNANMMGGGMPGMGPMGGGMPGMGGPGMGGPGGRQGRPGGENGGGPGGGGPGGRMRGPGGGGDNGGAPGGGPGGRMRGPGGGGDNGGAPGGGPGGRMRGPGGGGDNGGAPGGGPGGRTRGGPGGGQGPTGGQQAPTGNPDQRMR